MSDNAQGSGRLPLAGLVVIDFGQIFQGPYATLLLAKGGADVIKVEPPSGSRYEGGRGRGPARRCRLRC